jgi:flagellar M-ring protein FliF
MEQALETKLVGLLEPLAGRDNVRATVTLSYEQGSEERTDEIFDPTQVATLNMQRSEQSANQISNPSGIPGTASNTPAPSPNGSAQGSSAATPAAPPLLQKNLTPVYPQAGTAGQTLKEESGTYAVTKHTLHATMGPGRLRRITAAILVNDRSSMEGDGRLRHSVWRSRSPDEMHRMEDLAEASIGFDAKRGDQVVLENLSFTANVPETPSPFLDRASEQLREILRTQPGLLRTLAMGVCGLLLAIFVLRPIARQLAAGSPTPALLGPRQQVRKGIDDGARAGHLEKGKDNETTEDVQTASWRRGRPPAQLIFDSVSEHIRKEPRQSTRLLEHWINSSEHYGDN